MTTCTQLVVASLYSACTRILLVFYSEASSIGVGIRANRNCKWSVRDIWK